MSLLNLGTADSVQDYYLPDGTVNKAKLEEHLNHFRSKYGSDPNLVNSVQNMVLPDDASRNFGPS
jgi:hypothetical protein